MCTIETIISVLGIEQCHVIAIYDIVHLLDLVGRPSTKTINSICIVCIYFIQGVNH